MTAEISTMRLDIGDIQEALKNHDSWMEERNPGAVMESSVGCYMPLDGRSCTI